MVVNYPEAARRALEDGGYPFSEHRVFAVEIASEQVLAEITAAMTEAEINVLYAYAFLMRPSGKSGLVMCVDDNDLPRRCSSPTASKSSASRISR
jgi:hypothetical protein